MEFSQQKIIRILEKILDESAFGEVDFAENFTGRSARKTGYSSRNNRLTFVRRGVLQLYTGSGKEVNLREIPAGTTLVMKPFCTTGGVWEKCHETVALVCHPEYLRIIHAIHDRPGVPLLEPTYFYHLKDSLRGCTNDAINTLCALSAGKEADQLAPHMLKVIFTLLLKDVKNSRLHEYGKAYALWHNITEYISSSLETGLSRSLIAEKFNITETYVSRLFAHFSHDTFTNYLRNERLKASLKFLEQTDMTIEEIAWNTGFQSASYFIRCFRAAYHVSPGFRRRLKK
ncbi:MAG: helix-turn-helix transcriptional regulator [Lentisphaerae bacterium]|nr:helix-turn-helix transcriptional regulator [Lentisphaerota bacterium]